ncbi:MAG: T9SS type A sorting domain-containing protein, partial [Bacteroidota bacterium]
ASTMYYVTITSGTCTASDSVKVVVNPVPGKPVISLYGDSLLSSSTGGNQWYKNGILIPGANQDFYIPTQAGSYQVSTTNIAGCTSALSEPFLFTSLSGQTYPEVPGIFPNPTNGILCIKGLSGISGKVSLAIYSPTGKLFTLVEASGTVNISLLPSGIYVAKLINNDRIILTQKIALIK